VQVKRLNERAGGGANGAADYILDVLEHGYEHLVSLSHKEVI
jgi:hypothetical protein